MRYLLSFVLAFGAAAQPLYLPAPALTPGVANRAVTQANIHETICRAGWTKTIRPAASYTNRLKLQQMAELELAGKPSDYEEDHKISLECGGDPLDPRNLWPQPWPEARLKDVVETSLKRQVCSGQITLIAAQKILAGDWTAEYQRIKGRTVAEALKGKN